MERANLRAVGGKTDWDASSAQAAPWVEGKAHGLIEQKANAIIRGFEQRDAAPPPFEEAMRIVTEDRGFDLDAARAEAAKTYTDYFAKHTAYSTFETLPGPETGHLPRMADMPEEAKREFHEAVRMEDPSGRDVLYEAAGMQELPSARAQGYYLSQAGDIEANPVTVTKPIVELQKGGKAVTTLGETSEAIMIGVETLRSVMLGQEAGAYHKVIPRARKGPGGAGARGWLSIFITRTTKTASISPCGSPG